ncbi:MAG TPA: hypothetical protein VHB68_19210 [Steroidobacteraceae bacterium]|nr:hypothetical protein [Steroidobacteraceae bacterium]
MQNHPINRVTAFLPVVMSLLALLVIMKGAVDYERLGPPQHPEQGRRYLFMLMMLAQLPLILYFIVQSRREWRAAWPVLAAQLSLWGLSFAAALYLPGLS